MEGAGLGVPPAQCRQDAPSGPRTHARQIQTGENKDYQPAGW